MEKITLVDPKPVGHIKELRVKNLVVDENQMSYLIVKGETVNGGFVEHGMEPINVPISSVPGEAREHLRQVERILLRDYAHKHDLLLQR